MVSVSGNDAFCLYFLLYQVWLAIRLSITVIVSLRAKVQRSEENYYCARPTATYS